MKVELLEKSNYLLTLANYARKSATVGSQKDFYNGPPTTIVEGRLADSMTFQIS